MARRWWWSTTLNTRVVAAELRAGEVRLVTENYRNQGQVVADRVLVSVGRVPQVQGLDLEAGRVAGFQMRQEGVTVDAFLRTSNPHVYAAGDVCMTHKYTHVAQTTAEIAVR